MSSSRVLDVAAVTYKSYTIQVDFMMPNYKKTDFVGDCGTWRREIHQGAQGGPIRYFSWCRYGPCSTNPHRRAGSMHKSCRIFLSKRRLQDQIPAWPQALARPEVIGIFFIPTGQGTIVDHVACSLFLIVSFRTIGRHCKPCAYHCLCVWSTKRGSDSRRKSGQGLRGGLSPCKSHSQSLKGLVLRVLSPGRSRMSTVRGHESICATSTAYGLWQRFMS